MNDMLKQAEIMTETINIMQRMSGLMQQLVATTHHMVSETHEMQEVTNELRDHISDFEDFWRPIRSYFYWEKHCHDIPICYSIRNIFDTLDGVDEVTDRLQLLVANLDQLDVIMPQLIAQFPEMISIMQGMRTMMLTMHSTMSGVFNQMDDSGGNTTAMGKAFDTAKNDDSFYLPPDVFKTKDFKRVMNIFLSPDGKAVRMLISQKGDPASPEGISRVEPIKSAAEEALKGTPLEDAKIYLAGTAAQVKDLVQGSTYDLVIAGIAALCLIFTVMLIITRSFVAALVIVGTVLVSLGASFGLSVFVWQYLAGIQIHWAVLVMSVIMLLAVGSDYNLLLGRPHERRNRRRHKDRHHSCNGWYRQGRDERGAGVRVHDGVHGGQRPAHYRSDRDDDRTGSAVRHAGSARVHDAIDRCAAGALVLVAATGAAPPRQYITSADRTPAGGTCPIGDTAAVTGGFQ